MARSGQVAQAMWLFAHTMWADDGNSDNRANSAQLQVKLQTRAQLGNIHHMEGGSNIIHCIFLLS
jgi:hypothetical protein